MKAVLVLGAFFLCAGAAMVALDRGFVRLLGVVLLLWAGGTVPAAFRMRREEHG